MLHDEGYVKFSVLFQQEPLDMPVPRTLLSVRDTLHQMGLIGVYPDGIGFGNVSVRVPGTEAFFITGTQTGSVFPLTENEVALVTQADIPANTVHCRGSVAASSETMTHAACYLHRKDISLPVLGMGCFDEDLNKNSGLGAFVNVAASVPARLPIPFAMVRKRCKTLPGPRICT